MTVITTRPDATPQVGGAVLTGAATKHAALNDNLDSSYIAAGLFAVETIVGFAEPTIPAGGAVKRYTLKARVAQIGGGTGQVYFDLYDGTVNKGTSALINVTNATPTTITLGYFDTLTALADIRAGVASTGNCRIYEYYIETTYVAKPTITVNAPTGSITATNLPTASWTDTLDSDGGGQFVYDVKIFSAAQYGAGGFNPATSTPTYQYSSYGADLSHQITTALANGTYKAYVQISQLFGSGSTYGSNASAWTAGPAFTVTVTPPNNPTIGTATSDGEIDLTLTASASGVTTERFQVQRSEDSGATWGDLRTDEGDGVTSDITSRVANLIDYTSGNGQNMKYQVRAGHDISAGNTVWGAWVVSSTVSWSSDNWWLKDVTNPSNNLIVTVRSQPSTNRAARQSRLQAFGDTNYMVVSDTRQAREGDIVFKASSDAERNAIEDTIDNSDTVLVQAPPGTYGWPDRYVSFGDEDDERALDAGWFAITFLTYNWAEVDAPA